jgi:hypothetical protein
MINLKVDEAYAFDYLSILYIKRERGDSAFKTWYDCSEYLKSQLERDTFEMIINSKEYKQMIDANLKTFNMVDLAKEDKCTARDVDVCNYERYKAKIALQAKFFTNQISEIKIGYEKYEK